MKRIETSRIHNSQRIHSLENNAGLAVNRGAEALHTD